MQEQLFREQLEVMRDMIIGALDNGDLDVAEVRQALCELLEEELIDLEDLAE